MFHALRRVLVQLGCGGRPSKPWTGDRVRCPCSRPHPCRGVWAEPPRLSQSGSSPTTWGTYRDLACLRWRSAVLGVGRGLPGVFPGRLCPFLPANSGSCLLSSLRHLGPLQLRHHPPSEHRGRRVDDVSSPVTVLPHGAGGTWISGRLAGVFTSFPPCRVHLSRFSLGPGQGGHSPRPSLGLGPGSQMPPECPRSETLQALCLLPGAWPVGARGRQGCWRRLGGGLVSGGIGVRCWELQVRGGQARRRLELVWDQGLEGPR